MPLINGRGVESSLESWRLWQNYATFWNPLPIHIQACGYDQGVASLNHTSLWVDLSLSLSLMLEVGTTIVPVMGTWCLFDTTQLTSAPRLINTCCIKFASHWLFWHKMLRLLTSLVSRCVKLDVSERAHFPTRYYTLPQFFFNIHVWSCAIDNESFVANFASQWINECECGRGCMFVWRSTYFITHICCDRKMIHNYISFNICHPPYLCG